LVEDRDPGLHAEVGEDALDRLLLHVFFLGVHLQELAVLVLMKEVLGTHSVQMCTVDLEEVDQLFVLSQEHFQDVLRVVGRGDSELLGGSLARRLLARQVLDQFEDLVTVLGDDILRELLHGGRRERLSEPAAHILTVLLEDVLVDWVVADKRAGCARGD